MTLELARLSRAAAVDAIIEAHNVEHGESCDCDIGLAIEQYEALAGHGLHEPGDSHRYHIECMVCGEPGTLRVSVDPDRAGGLE